MSYDCGCLGRSDARSSAYEAPNEPQVIVVEAPRPRLRLAEPLSWVVSADGRIARAGEPRRRLSPRWIVRGGRVEAA